MRAIASAKALSEILGSKLEIAWIIGPGLSANFEDLFKELKAAEIKNYNLKYPILSKVNSLRLLRSNCFII
ncbi:MAG: hypothetical protein GTO02_06190 [Candidatus Dadabacteria bacterium]|nr:hypothetical protein [Candidatus Dadabacteria bacterium]NIQ13990.1 hypothetical protein [Candidatus Dadabacteria bacterium]